MVIISNKPGQLANSLFLFSSFIANAMEHKYTLVNPTFKEYHKYFNSTLYNEFNDYPIYTKWFHLYYLIKIFTYFFGKIGSVLHFNSGNVIYTVDRDIDINSSDFLSLFQKKKLVLIYGWRFRDIENVKKHKQYILNFFSPVEKHQRKIDSLIRECRQDVDILVGVHIRRGDFRTYEQGRYYYNDEIYSDKMRQIEDYFTQHGKKVAFIVCSNEEIDLENFNGFKIHSGPGHELEDLYSLAQCDYIIGPNSTYSMWASFYGEVPLFFIQEPDITVDFNKFWVVST